MIMEIFQFSLDVSWLSFIIMTVKKDSVRLLATARVDKAKEYMN